MLIYCLGAADVHVDNVQSQGLCKSLGGKKGMRTCWSVSDVLVFIPFFGLFLAGTFSQIADDLLDRTVIDFDSMPEC